MIQNEVWERLIDKELECRSLKEENIRLQEAYARARNLIVQLQDQVENLSLNSEKRPCLRCKKEKGVSG